ncbi:MAG: SDR family NAD(P)-dependent oxidoreductase [Oligoflexales bacterium]
MNSSGSVAILLGSAGGLGQALYPYLKKKYSCVVTIDCVEDKQSDHHIVADIREKESLQKILCFVEEKGQLDALIFATGLGSSEIFWEQEPSVFQKIIDINFVKPVEIIHGVSSFLIKSQGHVVFIGSTSAFLPSQKWLAYSISKSSLDHFCRSLQREWKKKVTVSMFHPGPMKTNMHKNLGMDLKKIRWKTFRDPDWMAQKIMKCFEKPSKYRIVPEWKQNVLITCVPFFKFLWAPILRRYYEKKEMSHHRKL